MNRDLETGDTPVKAGETAFMGQDDRGAHTTTSTPSATRAATASFSAKPRTSYSNSIATARS